MKFDVSSNLHGVMCVSIVFLWADYDDCGARVMFPLMFHVEECGGGSVHQKPRPSLTNKSP